MSPAKKDKTEAAPKAQKAPAEPAGWNERRSCKISFPADYSGPAEVVVRLPNGGAVRLSVSEKVGAGVQEHTTPASPREARQFEKAGLSVEWE